jgi:hypothetical protein
METGLLVALWQKTFGDMDYKPAVETAKWQGLTNDFDNFGGVS